METVDYKALIQARKQKGSRPIVRHVICLDPELYAELEEAQQELKDQILAEQDESAPAADRRGGGLSPRSQAEHRVAEVEKRIAEVSIVGVFKAFTSEVQAERHDKLEKEREASPDDLNALVLTSAREEILLTFQHFEGPGRKRLDLDKSDLETMLPDWSHGEVVSLANKIGRASTDVHDAPKSVRLSLLNQHSDAT